MAGMNETPKGDRTHIAFFGLRNAGKSTLVNAITGQDLAIVNDRPGTTTDPVSKAMEILPLGPCLLTDTAGLDDDEGELGALRVKKTLGVLATADVAVWVSEYAEGMARADELPYRQKFLDECRARHVTVLAYHRGESVEALKARLAQVRLDDLPRPLVADLVAPGDLVVCVCPIDSAAPKGRLILPQQQVVREILDAGGTAIVCRETELADTLMKLAHAPRFVITDSQAFGVVAATVPPEVPLTSFSIVFARAKGDLGVFCTGVQHLARLKDGDRVLIAEGCTHRRQCGDIGTVKLPKWLEQFAHAKLAFDWTSGGSFPDDLAPYAAVVHCGGCMLTRRVVQNRIARCTAQGVPIVNYGVAIAACHGITAAPDTCMVKR
ncbi:MAG: [FeFe] hydrogenase H-cluster maturation GTPase HydF [Kiritimatiellia bacterium]